MNRSPRANVRRLAVGRLISVTGGAAAYTALMFTIWERTHSAALQSLALFLTFGATGLLGPFAGALGDRFDRRRVMVISEAVAAAFFGVMAFVHDPGLLIGLAFGSAVAETPFWAASGAAIPNLVEGEEDIAWANSLLVVGRNAGIAAGPLIGGVLLGVVGASWVFGINAISFVLSLLLTLSVRARFTSDRARDEQEEHRGVAAGLRFLRREPVLFRMTIAWVVFLLGAGMGMVADAALAEFFHAGAAGFGLIITCWGGGSVLGSLAGRWLDREREPLALVFGAAIIAVGSFGVGVSPVFWGVLACAVLWGAADGITIVAEQGIMQRRTPDAVRGRVMAGFEAVLSLSIAVAYLFAAPVLRALGPQAVYRLGGISAAAAACVLLPLLRLRSAKGEEEPSEGPAVDAGETSLDLA